MTGSVPRFWVLFRSACTWIRGSILSDKVIFYIVNEHAADDISVNRMTKVSANLSKKSLEQWEELDPVSSPISVFSWISSVEIWSGIADFFITIVKTSAALVMLIRLKVLRFFVSFRISQHFWKVREQSHCSEELFAHCSLQRCWHTLRGVEAMGIWELRVLSSAWELFPECVGPYFTWVQL